MLKHYVVIEYLMLTDINNKLNLAILIIADLVHSDFGNLNLLIRSNSAIPNNQCLCCWRIFIS